MWAGGLTDAVHRTSEPRTSAAGVHATESAGADCNPAGGLAAHPTDPDTAWFAPAVKDEKRVPVDGALFVPQQQVHVVRPRTGRPA